MPRKPDSNQFAPGSDPTEFGGHPAWKPGESGNPSGKAKPSATQRLKELSKGGPLLIDQLWHIATTRRTPPQLKATILLALVDRLEGKPRQSIDAHVETQPILFAPPSAPLAPTNGHVAVDPLLASLGLTEDSDPES